MKKILILAHENEVDHIVYISSKLIELGYTVDVFVCDFFSFFAGDDYVYKKVSNKDLKINKIYNINYELKYVSSLKKNDVINIDWEYLKKFESKLDRPFIVKNIYNDFYFNETYSPRDYYCVPENKDIMFKFIEILCKKIETIDLASYSLVYSCSTTNFCRCIVAELSEKLDIPIISIIERFYKTTFIQDTYFKKKPKYFLEQINDDGSYKKFLNKFTSEKPKVNEKANYNFGNFIKNTLFLLKENFRIDRILRVDIELKKVNKNRYFFIKSFFYVRYTVFRDNFRNYKIFKLCNKNRDKKIADLKKINYIYFPLHFVPESGVMNHKKFLDEFYYIQILAKILPVDYRIIVKPNPYTFKPYMNQYPYERYLKISKMPNVIMIGPDVSSNELIKNSKGVITIAGSSSLEALFFKKPGFLISKTEFSEINGINIFNEDNFMDIINNWDENKFNDESLKNFITNMSHFGFDEVSENIIFFDPSKKSSDPKLKHILDKIIDLLNNHYLL